MRIQKILKFMFHLFCIIVTAQVIFIGLFHTISEKNSTIDYRNFHSMIVTALVGVLPTIIFFWTEKVSRRNYSLFLGLHFILTTSFVFISLNYFENLARDNITHTIILFLVIYIAAHLTVELRAKKKINKLNERIRATHQE